MARPIERRQFLAGALSVGAVGLVKGPLPLARTRPRAVPHGTTRPATAGAAVAKAAATRTLVLLTLYGGNDGLNTVVPYEDPAYNDNRGNIAIAPNKLLTLGSGYGLNPAMPGFKSAWDAGQLAIVQGVGYPEPNLSHFQSMDIWQSGSTSGDEASGWLGRWLDRTGHSPLQACSIGPTVLPAMAGNRRKAAALQDSTYPGSQLPDADAHFLSVYRELELPISSDPPLVRGVAGSGASMLEVSKTVSRAMTEEHPPVYPIDVGDLGTQLGIVSQLIRANVPTQVFGVSQGGYDTHAGEVEIQTANLRQLDGALSAFFSSIAGSARGAGTVVAIYSEFGRRVDSNASGGSDHGTANNVYVIGPPVKGGFYGEPSSLTKLDENGNLIYSVDYRSVYATLLEGVLGAEPKPVLGHTYPTLGFV